MLLYNTDKVYKTKYTICNPKNASLQKSKMTPKCNFDCTQTVESTTHFLEPYTLVKQAPQFDIIFGASQTAADVGVITNTKGEYNLKLFP